MDRRIAFQGIQNVRDLGGLSTSDGRVIKSGLLLRSANLAEATLKDQASLRENCHLTKIIDLRTSQERSEKPDAVMDGVEYVAMPVFDGPVAGISHEKEQRSVAAPDMEQLYGAMVTDAACRKNLGHAAQCVMEHDFSTGSVLWHCTEGKDRCGLLTMILLSALGVERSVIMEDYLLTNETNAPKAERYYQYVIAAGKTEEEAAAVRSAFLADARYMAKAFEAIDAEYTDLDVFLSDGLGISSGTIDRFRNSVLQ